MSAMFPGTGWEFLTFEAPGPVDPNSWGQRKLDAIKRRRAETGDAYQVAKDWVELTFPEFAGTAESRGLLRDRMGNVWYSRQFERA